MTNLPLVSVIMPAHNSAGTISESIESVLNQTFPNWELLVINDNSSDNTEIIVKEYIKKDSRIKYFETDKTFKRPFYPRNIGIENAKGRFIAFLDSDDLWLPTKLEHQLPLFEMNDVAIVFSYYAKMNSDGKMQNRLITSPLIVDYEYLLKGDCIGNLTGIYDTSKVGKVYQKNIHHEDYLMWLEILKQGRYAMNTNTIEAFYRTQKQSVSGNKFKTMQWHWNILRNELKLPLFVSVKYFSHYAIKGLAKFLK
ncbi:MAG: glycosyltransferase family 2 protein [Bacteroidales bacterium]|nr:glycosyltransferase family 2 protein [Bacteroidales bacterium]